MGKGEKSGEGGVGERARYSCLTLSLSFLSSVGVRVSDLAMTGMIFTRWCSCFMNSMSRGFRLHGGIRITCLNGSMQRYAEVFYPWPTGLIKYRQQ